MRQLTINESSKVSGAEHHDVMVIDPVAAAQTFLLLMSIADQEGFRYGSVITGMTAGTIGGGYLGYVALGAGLTGAAGAIVAGGAGAVVGGLAAKGAANFMVGSYNWIMS